MMTPLAPHPSLAADPGPTELVALLAARAGRGERAAFEQLIDRFQAEIFRMVYFRTRSRMDAEDLTQEVFLQAYRHLSRLHDPGRFRSWLYAIATNRVRDFLRRKRFLALFRGAGDVVAEEPPDREPYAVPGSLDRLIQKEFWAEVERLAAQLSRWEREVFTLRFLDQLSLREIAEVLKKSESAVKTHLYRALAKFKESRELIEILKGASS